MYASGIRFLRASYLPDFWAFHVCITMETISHILQTLGIGENPSRVYMELLSSGEVSPRLLARRLGMSRPSIYDQIKTLEASRLVDVRDLDGKLVVAPADPRVLRQLLAEKKEDLEHKERALERVMNSLRVRSGTEAPRIKFFDGEEALRKALHDILWTAKSEVLVLWPYEEMLEMLGEEYLRSFNEKRLRQHITMKTIWPKQSRRRRTVFEGSDRGVMRRYSQEAKGIEMGYTIYEDKVIFISSRRECFGFVVTSHDFATLMRMQFSVLWSTSVTSRK